MNRPRPAPDDADMVSIPRQHYHDLLISRQLLENILALVADHMRRPPRVHEPEAAPTADVSRRQQPAFPRGSGASRGPTAIQPPPDPIVPPPTTGDGAYARRRLIAKVLAVGIVVVVILTVMVLVWKA